MTIETTLSLDEAAELVDKSPDWLKRRLSTFEHLRIGRSIRFTPDQAEALVRSFTVRPRPQADPAPDADPLRSQTSKSRNRSR